MKKISKVFKINFGVIFIILILSISILSFYKLMVFYTTGKTDYNEWNAETNSKFETDYISNFLFKYQYVNINGFIKKVLHQNQMNGVVKLNNGYLLSPNEKIPEELINQRVKQVQSFNEHLAQSNIQYLYITIPYVVDKYDSQLPIGIVEYGNENLDNYRKDIEANDIQNLDLRDSIHDDGMETYDLFYHTDHHWTTEGGFYAYQKIIEYLENTNEFKADSIVKDLNNYTITTYKNWHLGSNGQRTGKYYAGIDDFDLILPKFDTKIENWDNSSSGTIEEMLIDKNPLQNKDYMSRYTYDFVMGKSCGNYHNPNASVDKTVLIIGDSFSNAMCPYFILTFSNIVFVQAYYANQITENFIQTYQPDIVISAYYITSCLNDEAYNFSY